MFALRPYQQRDANALRESYRAGKRAPLYVLSTGGGKTITFCHIAQGAAARSNVVLIVVHRQELLMQASSKLEENGVPHGLIAPGHTPTRDLVQIASVQTLVRRLGKLHITPQLIISDEAHHATAGSWRKVINAYPQARLLGVTATPIRMDGQGLGTHAGGVFDDLIIGPSMRDLIREGFLVQPVVFAPPTNIDMSGLHSRGGDYVAAEIAARLDKAVITGDAVKHYRKLCDGQPSIAFCASIQHAEHVAAEFRAAGYRAGTVDGKMPDAQRRRIIRHLGDGTLQVLTSCDLISEGTDIPVVSAAILLRPTQSLGLFLQQTGRALRPAPGKARAYIIDHVGNTLRHGLPDEPREWTLDGLRRGPKAANDNEPPAPPVKQCGQCYGMHQPAPKCPHCGFVYPIADKAPDQVEGELQELTPEQLAAHRRTKRREEAQAQTLEDLQAIGRARGYKPGWAAHRWQARQRRSGGAPDGGAP